MSINRWPKLIILVASAFICMVSLAVAHKGATGIVKERMDAMKDIGVQMKLMKKMIRGKLPYEAAKFKNAAETISKHGIDIPKQFPKGSMQKPTQAKPEIWEDWKKFDALAQELTATSRDLAEKAVKNQNIKVLRKGFRKLAKTCKSCHKQFRFKK